MKEKTCCFTGHRIIPMKDMDDLRKNIDREICNLINCGITDFISGAALGFDTVAARCVIEQKKINSEIRLIIAVPCRDQDKRWNENQKKQYSGILDAADEVVCLSESYNENCMRKRNEYMVDRSSCCIAYYRNRRGGTFSTIKYAMQRGLYMHYV